MTDDQARSGLDEQPTQHLDSPTTAPAPQPTYEPAQNMAQPTYEPATAGPTYAENPTVAVPQTPYQQPTVTIPHPSEPFPQVVATVPGAYPPAPTRPKAKVNRVLVVLVAVFFVAAGTFGALWFVERGDHRTTQGQLTSTRADVDDTRTQLQAVQRRANEADGLNSDLSIKRARLQQDLDDANKKLDDFAKEPTPCADAGRALAKSVRANDQKAGEDAAVQIFLHCK